jgi:hypothetical protein
VVEQRIDTVLRAASAVTALVGDRISPAKLRQTTAYPAITYLGISGNRENHLTGYASLENPLIQIDAWAVTLAGAIAVSDAIIAAMYAATTFSAILPGRPTDIWDDEVEKWRRSCDFSVWNRE